MTPTRKPSLPADLSAVYVYLRYSSDGQSEGDSFARQREQAERQLADYQAAGVPVHWLEDPGFSAFHGEHVRRGQMGVFLEQLRSGQLRDGLFVCESVSRLSRQGAFAASNALNLMLESGFSIWILQTGSGPFNKSSIPRFIGVEIALLADLAREESQQKSEYSTRNWERKRKAARESGAIFTREVPNWLDVVDGKFKVIPERVSAIQDLFEKARSGWGISRLVRYANTAGLQAPGKQPTWHFSLINRVLTNRALLGEFQPRIGKGKQQQTAGEPLPDYYPAVIAPDLFYAVQEIRARASAFPSRRDGNNYNYLMGLATCACGGAWRRMNKNSGVQEGYALYGCSNRQRAATKCPNINARVFDFQFVSYACDAFPTILESGEDPNKERILSLRGQLDEIRSKRAKLVAFIETNADLAEDFAPRLRDLKSDQAALSAELEALELMEPPPPGFNFGERVEVFIPAYLDVYSEGTEEFEDAYRARALFRTHIVEAVKSVSVSIDRTTVEITLKNGHATTLPLDLSLEFSAVADTEDEITSIRYTRAQQLRKARHAKSGI